MPPDFVLDYQNAPFEFEQIRLGSLGGDLTPSRNLEGASIGQLRGEGVASSSVDRLRARWKGLNTSEADSFLAVIHTGYDSPHSGLFDLYRGGMTSGDSWTKTWTFFQDAWHEGNTPIWGPRTHALWLCSCVFDGARAFEGVTPDLELHCERVNESAKKLYLKPLVSTERWVELAKEGIKKFSGEVALYIRPMYWAERESPWIQSHDPESTRWCLSIYEAPMREPKGFSITLSPFRRPTLETMPVDAKAGCLYPNNARSLFEAQSRGFDNAVVCDSLGNVAELATSNLFFAKSGIVYTPVLNGTFLAGITRQRIIGLLRGAGVTVVEKTIRYSELEAADEIFSTGNYSKVVPVTKIEGRTLEFGPFYKRARELYWKFAHS